MPLSPTVRPRLAAQPVRLGAGPRRHAFTLIELMAVMAIIVVFMGVLGLALRNSGSDTIGLQSAQTTLVSLLNLARSHAAVSGRDAALFVHYDPSNADRFMRFLVVARLDEGTWKPVNEGTNLPNGVFVVPYTAPAGPAVESGVDWTGVTSTALADDSIGVALLSDDVELWRRVDFKSVGTTEDPGTILVSVGTRQLVAGAPVKFLNPDGVRGVSITAHCQIVAFDSH